MMLSLDEIKTGLVDRRPKIVAERTGLTIPTICQIRDGKNTNPSLRTMLKLSNYLQGVENDFA